MTCGLIEIAIAIAIVLVGSGILLYLGMRALIPPIRLDFSNIGDLFAKKD